MKVVGRRQGRPVPLPFEWWIVRGEEPEKDRRPAIEACELSGKLCDDCVTM
jgi:hypothetical protein